MMSIVQIAALLPLLLASATAQSMTCRTTLGTKAVNPVPTSTIVSTSASRPTQTLVVQKTVTTYLGLTSTSMRTATKTETVTDTTDTDTFYVTSTFFDVQTFRATTTMTTTTTDTITTATTSTTVTPTSAGFLNIRDTLNRGSVARRAMENPHSPVKRALLSGKQGVLAQTRPNRVVCTSYAKNTNTFTSYTTLAAQTSTKAYWSRTLIRTTTVTVQTTIIPEVATEVITEVSTSKVQTTTTLIETDVRRAVTTTTESLPGPTIFNACNPNNEFGATFRSGNEPFYVVNVANNGPNVASNFETVADGASSALECCNACQRLSTCETFVFRKAFRNCFLLSHPGATCRSQSQPNFILSSPVVEGGDISDGAVVGNGNCGYVWSGTPKGSLRRVDGYP
ncbi:uncharacterized protein RHO25_010424 [Cercospora beticola]|uniref:Apple domain-containing protein n=2 Tax=Cercospora beticola TaxID=122368 RepID=A0ABZ0P1V3_CERBT|nr:hypothetical protein RHO25_010424 [Cercospora beticola]